MSLINWFKNPLPIQSLYFVTGEDPFFLSEIKKTFKKQLLSRAGDFNYDEVTAGETALGDILTIFETLPMLSEKRLLFCFKSELFSEKDWAELMKALSHKKHPTVFVFFFSRKDKRKKHFKFLEKEGLELPAQSPKNWETESWLDFLAKRESLQFSKTAKLLFQELVGQGLMEMQMEMKKLKHYLGEQTKLEDKDVLACCSRLKTDSLFDLTSALGNRDIAQALKFLAHLLEQNQNEMLVLSLLSRHIRILARIKQGQKKKLSSSGLAQSAGLSPYFLKNYLNQAELWTEKQLEETLQQLFLTDQALKSSPLSSHLWLENFILKACS